MSFNASQYNYDSFPANQLGDPHIAAAYYGYDYASQHSQLPEPLEGSSALSQDVIGATQAFEAFVERHKDPVLTLEFTSALLTLIHEGAYDGPPHVISREAYENLLQKKCPLCRREVIGAEDISKKVKAYLEKWKEARFDKTGDNSLHKALASDIPSVFLALLECQGASKYLFEANNAGVTPFQLLCEKDELREAFDKTLAEIALPKGMAFSYISERNLVMLSQNGEHRPLSLGDTVAIDGKEYTLKASDIASEKPSLYLLDDAQALCKVNALHVDPRFTVSLSLADGNELTVPSRLPLILGRHPSCNVEFSSNYISRRHWLVEINHSGQIVLSECRVTNPSSLERRDANDKVEVLKLENSIPLQTGDKIFIKNTHVFTFNGIELYTNVAGKKRRFKDIAN